MNAVHRLLDRVKQVVEHHACLADFVLPRQGRLQ
jgi:hypothetical protein